MQNIRVLLAVFFPHNVHVNDIVEIDGHRPTRIFFNSYLLEKFFVRRTLFRRRCLWI